LEINFIHKNVSHGHNFAKKMEKMNFLFLVGIKAQNQKIWVVFTLFGYLKVNFTQSTHETSENCRTGFPWCLITSHQISSENIRRKKVMDYFVDIR